MGDFFYKDAVPGKSGFIQICVLFSQNRKNINKIIKRKYSVIFPFDNLICIV